MASLFPTIFLGGDELPLRQELLRRLSSALDRRDVAHYLLHPASLPNRAALIERLAAPHLPLLLDGGALAPIVAGQVAACCTYALLLAHDATDIARWKPRIATSAVLPLGKLPNDTASTDCIIDNVAMLHALASDEHCFAALVDQLAAVMAYSADELYRAHLATAAFELVIDLERPIYPLPAHRPEQWHPSELPALLASLPAGEPLGIYGRGPVWLYAALAAFAAPKPCQIFDRTRGWMTLHEPERGWLGSSAALHWQHIAQHEALSMFEVALGEPTKANTDAILALPAIDGNSAVVLCGELPAWLWGTLTRAYRSQPWVAVSTAGAEAVVVCSQGAPPVGALYSIPSSPPQDNGKQS